MRIIERTADGYFKDTERGELRADGGCVHDRTRRLPVRAHRGGDALVVDRVGELDGEVRDRGGG